MVTKHIAWTRLASVATALMVLGAAAGAKGAGFALKEQSASGLGTAFAGATAAAEDATTLFFNPAGMAELSGNQFYVSGSFIMPSAVPTNQGSTGLLGGSIAGSVGGDAGRNALVPALYGVWDFRPDLKFGLALTTPFGLTTDYNDNWYGRYSAINSHLRTTNIQPTVSYRVSSQFTVGAGIQAQNAAADLSNAIDFGTICFGSLPAATCGALGLSPRGNDGNVRLTGDDWAVGGNVGLQFTPAPGTRLGLDYRSQISHTITGNAIFQVPAAATPLRATGAFANTGAQGKITTPDSINFGLRHELNPQWALLSDASWTRWSVFKQLQFTFTNPAQATSTKPENWQDALFVSGGATFKPAPLWTLRAGLAYDQSPIKAQFRTPRIPDTDRYWITVGASYDLTPGARIDAGYAHIFLNDGSIADPDSTGVNVTRASYKLSIDIVSLGLSIKF
ncbi:MAG: outer membrane protein transport protein [Proteobacteria bacterium]|nr:outer membrane protein transport protein [Pseudomonadota bacterium]MBI3498357.1 outer membrane protein transport protein [Pseudomonadota bacterium]